MRRKPAHQIVTEKREWHYQCSAEEKDQGFKGWHSRGYLPHFDAPGVQQFITYRLADSIPAELRHEWAAAMQHEDGRERFRRMEVLLDRGHGACALRDSRIARMVQDNLWFHDGRSCQVLAWCVMPNHVHVLAEMVKPLAQVVKNWKSYTGSQANKLLGAIGNSFWQADYFDRYIRTEEHFRRVVRYIENNPVKAGLVREPGEWPWSSAPYRGPYGADVPPQIPKERGQPCPREGNEAATIPSERNNPPADRAVRASK